MTDAGVNIEHIVPFDDRFGYQTAYYHLIPIAVLAGIAAAIERDTS